MPTLQLYPFRFRDPLTGKWVRARHKMQMPEMQRQYAEWEITGAAEIRHVTETSVQPFNPFAWHGSSLHKSVEREDANALTDLIYNK